MKERESTAIFSLLDTPAFGGAEQYMFSHLRYLNKQGHAIILATNNTKVKNEIISRLTIQERKTFQVADAPYRLDVIGNWKGFIKFFVNLPHAIFWCFITLKQLKKKIWKGYLSMARIL